VSGTISNPESGVYSIAGTVADAAGAQARVSVPLTVYCGNPATKGDDRDTLVAEYLGAGVKLNPGYQPDPTGFGSYAICTDFTQSHPELNISTKCPFDVLSWEAIQQNLPAALSRWQVLISIDPTINGPLPISSAYRNPLVNTCIGSKAADSYHMHGAAVDLSLPGSPPSAATYQLVNDMAIVADFDWTETYQPKQMECQPGRQACVHGDLRNHISPFISP